ncbi:hypothetical protein Vafri_20568 [Volvox africanus]|uniref:Uncharacterized protein n=1 Tax=Volvox africanus TaxID=51714 RepID=A0A8J4BRM4_9CHLO|nr:hypothetical protein Vafri_20568 [Volvox africanus]
MTNLETIHPPVIVISDSDSDEEKKKKEKEETTVEQKKEETIMEQQKRVYGRERSVLVFASLEQNGDWPCTRGVHLGCLAVAVAGDDDHPFQALARLVFFTDPQSVWPRIDVGRGVVDGVERANAEAAMRRFLGEFVKGVLDGRGHVDGFRARVVEDARVRGFVEAHNGEHHVKFLDLNEPLLKYNADCWAR